MSARERWVCYFCYHRVATPYFAPPRASLFCSYCGARMERTTVDCGDYTLTVMPEAWS